VHRAAEKWRRSERSVGEFLREPHQIDPRVALELERVCVCVESWYIGSLQEPMSTDSDSLTVAQQRRARVPSADRRQGPCDVRPMAMTSDERQTDDATTDKRPGPACGRVPGAFCFLLCFFLTGGKVAKIAFNFSLC
jgi:hypothetical protein